MTQMCRTCMRPCQWIDCPTGGWWAHLTHPEDGHDADIVEVVTNEQLFTFAASLEIALEQEYGVKLYGTPVGLARILLADLLDDGWRPPVEPAPHI